jgi:subtilisin family serine protease
MKNLFLLLCLFFGQISISQVLIPGNTKADVYLIQKDLLQHKGQPSSEIINRFAVVKIKGLYFVSFLAEKAENFSRANLTSMDCIPGDQKGSIISLRVPLTNLNKLSQLPGIKSIQLAGKIKPFLDKAVKDIGADSVQRGIGLPQGYTGKNVLIGITDWGFDYSSPMFYDTLLQNTRILAAWDQYKTAGPPPTGFSYGTEYTTLPEFLDAGADTANIYSYATHGSHVAGIAGGSGAGTVHRGVAFEAKYLFATFLVDESAVLDAWEWMYQKSQSEAKRLVINMSWGLYHMGTLDGTSLLSQAIDAYSSLGVVFSNSGGNNGNVNFHIKKDFNNDSIRSRIEFYSNASNANMWGQSIHAWGESGNSFESGIQIYNVTGSSLLAQSPYYSTATTVNYVDTFLIVNADTIWYNISADASHPQNGRPQMRIRVKNTSSLRVLLKSRAVSSRVHYWNVTELSTDVGNWGMPFSASGTGTIIGDNKYGISEPSCTNSLLSVAAYASQYYTPGGSLVGGGGASFSSIGPRYDEVLKPEIAAPGVAVASSISSYTDNAFTSIGTVDFNGRTYPFSRFSGTSMAAPMVTGVIALILEANPYLSAEQIKEILIQTTREDNFTGVIPLGGSTQWGWGKIDAYNAVKLALITVGTEEIEMKELDWNVFPNPVINDLYFTLVEELPSQVQIIDEMGKVIERRIENASISVADLKPGNYFVRMEINGRIQQVRFVKL